MRRAAAAALAALTLGLSPQEQRGKAIYLRGGSLSATLGEGMTAIPASIVPCVNCHGEDGRGKPEGAVRPADITPESLTRAETIKGRSRPPYNRSHLKRAIAMGLDSAGHSLDDAMPRYQMTLSDAEDLLAYLSIVGHEPQPGVTDDAIKIRVLGAKLPEVAAKKIYGRRIELVTEGEALLTLDASEDPSASITAADRDRIPTLVVHTPERLASRYAFSMTAAEEDERAALRKVASPDAVLLTSSEAKARDFAMLPTTEPVLVAAPLPPTPEARGAAAQLALSIATKLLAQLGRDVTRSALVSALEHVYQLESATLPPITWTANDHHGTSAVWVMTLDRTTQRFVGKPGWVDGR